MAQTFTGRTPTSRKAWRALRLKLRGQRLSRHLHRRVEWLDGRGGGAEAWNFSQLREALAVSLEKSGYPVKAGLVRSCHQDFIGYRCKDNPKHVWARASYTCHQRLCPFEMKARSVRARKRFGPRIRQLYRSKYLVLSERNCGLDDLATGIASLWASWDRLTREFLRPFGVRGGVAALELTFNVVDRSWHPHLNIVLDCRDYLPFERLNPAWVEATEGRGRSSWITAVNAGTVFELLKYITKLVDFVDVPEAVAAFVRSIRRQRFIRSWGSLYGFEGEESDLAPGLSCPDCGSRSFDDLGVMPRNRVYWDAEGQTRFVFDST